MSHWTGDVATFETGTSWVYSGRFENLFGRLTYNGTASGTAARP